MTLTFDFESQGHKWFLMDDYFSVHVNINYLGTTVLGIPKITCICYYYDLNL